jgi:KaiC domain protein
MSEDDTAESDEDWFESAISGDADTEFDSDDEAAGPNGTDGSDTDIDGAPQGAGEGETSTTGVPADDDGPADDADASTGAAVTSADEPDVPAGQANWGTDQGDPVATGQAGERFTDRAEGPSVGERGESSFEDDGELFEDDFATAFGQASGDEFDDEDFESAIPRVNIGIQGLDNMIQGGVPERHLMVAIGSAGTGKTTFGLQFLKHGLARGDNCVFITLEQSQSAIMDTAAEYGWDFAAHEADDRLAVIDLDPIEMANSLDNIRGELPRLVEDFDADRFVLDSVSLLEMMYDDQARRRTEVYDFSRSLKGAGVTTLLTSEAAEGNPYASRYGIVEYLTDAVFVLQYVRPSDFRETRLAVEIQKIRNANHSRETKPYEITDDGISVYEQANIF